MPHPATPTILALAASFACATAAAQTPGSTEHARAELLVGVDAVAPGASFPVGVRVTTDPGWHVYWKYPGTAGLPTTVDWHLPDGFTVGPLQYPTPTEFDQPGGIVGYGYEGSALLTATVTAPDDLKPGEPVVISADVAWLVCADVCIPGSARVNASTRTGVAGPTTPAVDRAFGEADASNPRPVDLAPEVGPHGVYVDSETITVTVVWNDPPPDPSTIEWFPAVPDGLIAGPKSVRSIVRKESARDSYAGHLQTDATLKYERYAPDATTNGMETVVAFVGADGRRHGLVVPVHVNVRTISAEQPVAPAGK